MSLGSDTLRAVLVWMERERHLYIARMRKRLYHLNRAMFHTYNQLGFGSLFPQLPAHSLLQLNTPGWLEKRWQWEEEYRLANEELGWAAHT